MLQPEAGLVEGWPCLVAGLVLRGGVLGADGRQLCRVVGAEQLAVGAAERAAAEGA